MERESSTSAQTEVVVRGFPVSTWIYVSIYMAILAAVITVETHFLPAAWGTGGINIGPSGGFLVAMPLPYVFSFIMLVIISVRGIKVEKRSFALFYLATMVATWFSVFKGFYTTPASLFNIRVATADVHGYALPYFWMPSAEAVRGAYYRDSLNNLFVTYAAEWTPVIANYILWYVVSTLFFIGWAIVLRRLWVDVEVLPFPHAQGWITGEIALTAYEKTPDRRRRVFTITSILGIIFYIPYMIYSAYPGLPDFYGWLTGTGFTTWATGNFELTTAYPAVASSMAGCITIQTDPLKYAFFFLVPLDSLLSMTIGVLGFAVILPQILSYFGHYSGIYEGGIWDKFGMIYTGDPLWVDAISVGLGLGVLVFMVLINWRYFVDTIKQAASGETPRTEVSYRMGYLFVLIGGVGLIGIFIATGVQIQDAILGLIVILMQLLILTRARAYASNIAFMRGTYFLKPFWGAEMPAAPDFPAGKLFISTHTARWGTGCDTFGPYYSVMMGTMDGFKVGSMSGLHPSSVSKLCLIGGVLGAIIVIPVTFLVWHAYGFQEMPVAKEWDYFWDGDAGFYNGRPSVIGIPGMFGFALAGVLLFLRLRYIWWPIEPVGLFLGTTDLTPWHIGTLTPLIIWALKYAVIKVGGRKVYDEIGVPAAFGIIAGEMVGIILVSAINIVRYIALGG